MEAANGVTLFLDEIGDMPLEMQVKLLRALQQREVKPVGSTERSSINVRIVAATNRDLDFVIKKGAFRQDLYFRLNVVQVKLPPLRERKGDIPLLVASFLEKFSNPSDPPREMTEDATRRLMAYDWPGNLRELENAIERAIALGSAKRGNRIRKKQSVNSSNATIDPAQITMQPQGWRKIAAPGARTLRVVSLMLRCEMPREQSTTISAHAPRQIPQWTCLESASSMCLAQRAFSPAVGISAA